MKRKIAIIESQTLGTPTEIYEALYGDNKIEVLLIEGEQKTIDLKITNPYINLEIPYIPPMTRKEKRKQERLNIKAMRDNKIK